MILRCHVTIATLIATGCLFFMLKLVKKNLGIAKTDNVLRIYLRIFLSIS